MTWSRWFLWYLHFPLNHGPVNTFTTPTTFFQKWCSLFKDGRQDKITPSCVTNMTNLLFVIRRQTEVNKNYKNKLPSCIENKFDLYCLRKILNLAKNFFFIERQSIQSIRIRRYLSFCLYESSRKTIYFKLIPTRFRLRQSVVYRGPSLCMIQSYF